MESDDYGLSKDAPHEGSGNEAGQSRILPSTGSISLSQVNQELWRSATSPINMNESEVRALAKRPSGSISMNDLRGKANFYTITLPRGYHSDINIKNYLGGWNGVNPLRIIVPSDAHYTSTSTSTFACDITDIAGCPGGELIIKSGAKIFGRGGNGGKGGDGKDAMPGGSGGNGGPALRYSKILTLKNSGSVLGGGGGGGGGGGAYYQHKNGRIGNGGGGGGGGVSYGSGGKGGLNYASGSTSAGVAGGSATATAAGAGGSIPDHFGANGGDGGRGGAPGQPGSAGKHGDGSWGGGRGGAGGSPGVAITVV